MILFNTLNEFSDCTDISHRTFPEIQVDLLYISHQVNQDNLHRDVITPLLNVRANEVASLLKQSQFTRATESNPLIVGILSGQAAVFHQNEAYLVDVSGSKSRSVTQSESESIIMGPHDAFTEKADTNLSLIRSRIKSTHLKVIKLSVGEVTKTDVYILYIKDIANMDNVRELISRIKKIEVDAIFDTSMLLQEIDDSPYSIFPQFLTSERPDAIASKLVEGKIVGITEGSPSVFSAPTSFFEFFSSSDDYYQRWMLGTTTRLLRFTAFFITLSLTALYVSVTTYHYEMIPSNLLLTLTESRYKVPFPPLYEALFMETAIELLREAGARLPSKIAQTIGIVGGIVIGQAAVQAGLTSNILIITVAMSAIASFVTPVFIMSASIRLLRFGLIIMAGIWGNFGLFLGLTAILIHMCSLTSLGSSYLTPVAPFKPKKWKDLIIVAPTKFLLEKSTGRKSRKSRMKRT